MKLHHLKYREPIFGAEVDAHVNRHPLPAYENKAAWEAIARLPHWAKYLDKLSKLGKKWQEEWKKNPNNLPF